METLHTSEATNITEKALALIDVQYGREPETTQTRLPYHNGLHTRYVMQDFLVLGDFVQLEPVERVSGYCAAAAHDLVQGLGRHEDESRSADWLVFQMEREPGIEAAQLDMARLAILGTEPLFDNGAMVGQKVDQFDFPTQRHELVARLVASADLGRLYSPEGPYLAHLLLKELSVGQESISNEQLMNFQLSQIPFLESYRYPYYDANRLLTRQKSQVIEYHEQLIAKLNSGQITSWQNLIIADLAFMRGMS